MAMAMAMAMAMVKTLSSERRRQKRESLLSAKMTVIQKENEEEVGHFPHARVPFLLSRSWVRIPTTSRKNTSFLKCYLLLLISL
jgi:hypothetical protein